ncbi:MAG: hypothetical protein IJ779_04170 [Ruminococcus sp.]|nr:hypothetical protein [Ruminococcus sp.]
MNKQPKKKEGIARLMELAGTKKNGLTAACTLSAPSTFIEAKEQKAGCVKSTQPAAKNYK